MVKLELAKTEVTELPTNCTYYTVIAARDKTGENFNQLKLGQPGVERDGRQYNVGWRVMPVDTCSWLLGHTVH